MMTRNYFEITLNKQVLFKKKKVKATLNANLSAGQGKRKRTNARS